MSLENIVSISSPESAPELFQYFHSCKSGQSLDTSTSALLKFVSIPLPASWTVPYCDYSYTEVISAVLQFSNKKLPFNTAVEISYLRNEEQQVLLQYMSNHNMVPSMKQAKELKQISKERMLTYSEIDQICMNESTEKVQVQIPAKKLKQYFPETYSKAQMEEVIFMLLASWAEKQ